MAQHLKNLEIRELWDAMLAIFKSANPLHPFLVYRLTAPITTSNIGEPGFP